jgi:hypothetical protein
MSEEKKVLSEMKRYLPVLERAEADPELWQRLTQGTGIATLNGYRNALSSLSPDNTEDFGPGDNNSEAALLVTPHSEVGNSIEQEFKRYMSHAYMIGAVDSTGLRASSESFEQWFIEIKKPDFITEVADHQRIER